MSAASIFDAFSDPQDGAFDTSNWLIERKGFLPVPLIITEPAVGFGGGAAILFFHESVKESAGEAAKKDDEMLSLPPSISAVFGGYTENDSWMVGGGHFGSWNQDRIRYIGGIGAASLKLKFYGGDAATELDDNPLRFTIDGTFLIQELTFRINDSKIFIGGRYTFLGTDNAFDISGVIPGVPPAELDSNDAGLGLIANYDSRDNIMTPNHGLYVQLNALRYDDAFGGDFDYNYFKVSGLSWWDSFIPQTVWGLRLDGRFANGDVPFYALPYINLRGIPALRYQGQNVFVAEIEPRWDITYRWSLVGFVGTGWTAESIGDLFDSSGETAGGGGFRYLIARRLGMRAGVDVAVGPEEAAIYLTVGSSWY